MPTGSRVLLGLALVSILAPALAQDLVEIVRSYGLEEIEAPGDDAWKAEQWERKYALDGLPVNVRIDNGKLVLAQRTGNEPGHFPLEYATPSISYARAPSGSYSTQLYAIFKDGRPRQLIDANVRAIVPRNSELLLFSGYEHMISTGAIRRVASPAAKPRVSLVTLLPEAPQVVLEKPGRDDHLYIVTRSSLMSIFISGKHGDFLNMLFWSHGFAGKGRHSAVFYKDHLVIGSATGVVVASMQQDRVLSVRYFATKGRSVQLRPAPGK